MRFDNKVFARRLRQAIVKNGITVMELATKVDLGNKVIYRYMQGQINPSVKSLIACADVLDVSVDWLLGLTENDAGKPRLLTYDESIERSQLDRPQIVWAEYRIEEIDGTFIDDEGTAPAMIWAGKLIDQDGGGPMWGPDEYGRTVRLWTDEPTEEQRKGAKWRD